MAGAPVVLHLISLFCCGKNRLISYVRSGVLGRVATILHTHTPEGIGVYLLAL